MIDLLSPLVHKYDLVVLLGFGREGRSTYKLLRRFFSELPLIIADANMTVFKEMESENDPNLRFVTGSDYLNILNEKALVFKSPGVKLPKDILHPESLLTSQTDLFIQKFHKQMIGVSGTKGKSTTSSLVAYLLKNTGRDAVLLGNIGIPAFDKLDDINPETWIVFELSAHQLQHVRHSPHIAILLNIFPEHLDYFDGFEPYQQAKMNLYGFQNVNDFLVLPLALQKQIVDTKGKVLCFADHETNDRCFWFNESSFCFKGKTYPFPPLNLKGQHNKSNVMAAILAVTIAGVEVEDALIVLPEFKGLAHRLEYVRERDGIIFYNDSISTIPASTIAAIETLHDVGSLILGGFDRGLDYRGLVQFLENSDIKNIVFVGQAGQRMMKLFKHQFEGELYAAETFVQAVCWAQHHTPIGRICLLSPAAASYDEFHNFEHRGDTFKRLVIDGC
jgi:UDP-N-acetylmuramoylalanine--D-glutamate ligase